MNFSSPHSWGTARLRLVTPHLPNSFFLSIYLFIWFHQVLDVAHRIFIMKRGLLYFGVWTHWLQWEDLVVLMREALVAPRGVCNISSLARAWTHVPCTGRQVLNHWTIREVPTWFSMNYVLNPCLVVGPVPSGRDPRYLEEKILPWIRV